MNERFDTALQLWVDENGNPLPVQKPKPNDFTNISANQLSLSSMGYGDLENSLRNPNFQKFSKNVNQSGFQFKPVDFSVPEFQIPGQHINFTNRGVVGDILDKQAAAQSLQFENSLNKSTEGVFGSIENGMKALQQPGRQDFGNQKQNDVYNTLANVGKTYSLESALYGLGYSLGKKNYEGMTPEQIKRDKTSDVMMGIGTAGKLLIGGARTLTSGMANRRMNEWMTEEYKEKRRDAMVNNQQGSEDAWAAVGGAPSYNFEEGGSMPILPDYIKNLPTDVERAKNEFLNSTNESGRATRRALVGERADYEDYIPEGVSLEDFKKRYQEISQRRSAEQNTPSAETTSVSTTTSEPAVNPATKYDNLDFGKAFNQAREELGDGKIFTYKGKNYLIELAKNTTVKKTEDRKIKENSVKGTNNPTVDFSKYTDYDLGKAYSILTNEGRLDARKYIVDELKSRGIVEDGKGSFKSKEVVKSFQDGGEMPQEADIVTQLQQAVQNGEMTEEQANQYLAEMQQQTSSTQPQQGGMEEIQAQLQQAVQNGEMSEEEAMAYLQQISQQGGGQQQQQQPQITPEEAQQQLAMAVENGEITPEEAQTHLQQMFGNVQAGSEPQEAYTGELREKVKPEQYLTGEYTAGDDDKPHNAEVEKGEYLNRNGVTQQVLGDKHSDGGEKMNLEKGTIVISDKTRLGVANARALSLNTGMKIVAGDTYARVIDIFTKKIGLEKLNKEQEDLFKKLQKFEGKGNQKTQDLNNEFLNAKINDIEEKKQSLLQQREQLVQVLFEMQESSKKPGKDEVEFVDNSSEESQEVPKYQSGAMVSDATGEAILERYGADAYKYYLENWKNDPNYGFRDYVPMRERIKTFAEDYGVALPKNFDKLSEKEMDKLAGEIQMKVNDGVAIHYGTYVAPTQNGLQWLVDNGVLKKDDEAIKNIIDKNGKITIGSYGSLNEKQQQIVGNAVDGLAKEDKAKLDQYAIANFRDKKWFYRRPKEQEIYYTSAQEYGDAVKDKLQVGQPNEYATEKQGAYFLPKLLQIKKFKTQAELDKWKEENKNNADKKHGEYFSETGGDSNKFFKPVVDSSVEANKPEVSADKPLDVGKTKKRNNFFMLPDQSTLPPEALRAVPKYDIRYNYLDNIRLSPEQNLVENYRAYNEAKGKMEGLPDVMNHANLAMLTGNVAQANNQAINQINAQNAQMAQQVASANLQTLHKQAEMDLNLADQYDQRMNRALDVTRKDLEGYYDFNRRVHVGEFNTRHQLTQLNNLMDKYGVGADGVVQFDPLTNAPYGLSREQWIELEYKKQQEAAARAKAEKQQTEVKAKAEVAKTAPLPTSGWNQGK